MVGEERPERVLPHVFDRQTKDERHDEDEERHLYGVDQCRAHDGPAPVGVLVGVIVVVVAVAVLALTELVDVDVAVPRAIPRAQCYVHDDADIALAARVIDNAKTRRVSVCNALDCLLVHRALADRLDDLLAPCRAKGVGIHEAPEDWGHEWLSMNLSVRLVDGLDAALAHIARYGSGHSEAIVTRSPEAAERFRREVDAACVYVNTPTAFTDGGEFGLGAEIGISTQKLHARGPMGLDALTTYKWLIDSQGALRP